MTRFFLAASAITVGILFAGWASAETLPSQSCAAIESRCAVKPLRSGKPGETVRVCEKVRLVCSERTGVTTVQHVGR